MPDWNNLADEIRATGSTHDVLRRKYLQQLSEVTRRNVIIYYSGWLQKPNPKLFPFFSINDEDKNAFMTTIHEMDRKKGLDLILHTPGGETAATESLVEYLRAMFDDDVRAIIPQLAMSAGTMIACSCKSVVMGKQSSLGPIDPQLSGLAAHGVIEEFDKALRSVREDPSTVPVWQPIIGQYPPTFIGECQKAIDWSNEMTREWLISGMFKNDSDNEAKAQQVVSGLSDHALTKSHARHLSAKKCKELGLKVEMMEDDQSLQEAVLTVHHITMLTLTDTSAIKIVENQSGKAFIQTV